MFTCTASGKLRSGPVCCLFLSGQGLLADSSGSYLLALPSLFYSPVGMFSPRMGSLVMLWSVPEIAGTASIIATRVLFIRVLYGSYSVMSLYRRCFFSQTTNPVRENKIYVDPGQYGFYCGLVFGIDQYIQKVLF